MIELTNIRKAFNSGKPNEFAAVQGISLSIEAGKATVLKGPSGSGKTTLLSLIGCMARPTGGRIRLFDREITSLPERFLTKIRQRTFGGDISLGAATQADFFPWGAADATILDLGNGCQTRTVNILPTGIVEVGS